MTEIELTVDLDEHNRTGMYEDLCDQFSEDEVHDVLEEQLQEMYE